MTTALTYSELAPASATGPHATNDHVIAALDRVLSRRAARARLEVHDRDRRYPRDILDELRAAGLASLFDESRATAHHLTWLNALASNVSGSLAITIGVNALALLPLYIAGSEDQRVLVMDRVAAGAALSLLLTEWRHGSDLVRNEARADRGHVDARGAFTAAADGAHFRITGHKHLINGGAEHELLVCLLRTRGAPAADDQVDALSPGPDVGSAFTLFLVERGARVRATRSHRTLPCAAADISDVHLDGVLVGEDAVIGELGEGFPLVHRTLAISRGGISGLASGTATAARRIATAHAQDRMLYGRPILHLGAIGEHLARLHALDVAVAALSIKQAAFVNALGPGAAYITAVAKVACTALAEEAVSEGRRILGSRALVAPADALDGHESYERLVRDVVLFGVFDGTTHVMLDEIQWRLAQLAHTAKRDAGKTGLDAIARVYATPPRALRDAVRAPGRVQVMQTASHLAELAGVSDEPALARVSVVATALLDAVADLRRGARWDADQGLRFAAATALAHLEAIAALAELTFPSCRAALGVGPLGCAAADVPRYARIAPFAVAWLGTRAAAMVRSIVLRTSVDTTPIARAERELYAAVDVTLPPLVALLGGPAVNGSPITSLETSP